MIAINIIRNFVKPFLRIWKDIYLFSFFFFAARLVGITNSSGNPSTSSGTNFSIS